MLLWRNLIRYGARVFSAASCCCSGRRGLPRRVGGWHASSPVLLAHNGAPHAEHSPRSHPCQILGGVILVVAGARIEVTVGIIALAVAYVLLRAVGKLAGSIATVVVDPALSRDAAPHVLSPGILGVAFALNMARALGTDAIVLLSRRARHDRCATAGGGCTTGGARVRRLAALALAGASVLWVRRAGSIDPIGSAGTALALGFTLLGAWVTGDTARRLRLPRLSGYLLFGVLASVLANVITSDGAHSSRHRYRDDTHASSRPHLERRASRPAAPAIVGYGELRC